jgi:hypothetical protein
MRKPTMTLTAAALLLGAMVLQASAQNQQRGVRRQGSDAAESTCTI